MQKSTSGFEVLLLFDRESWLDLKKLRVQLRFHPGKVVQHGQLRDIFRELIWPAMKLAKVPTLVNQVQHVAESKWSSDAFVVVLDQVIKDARFDLKGHSLQFHFKQASELCFGRIKHFHFVRDSSQERLVTEFGGFEVR